MYVEGNPGHSAGFSFTAAKESEIEYANPGFVEFSPNIVVCHLRGFKNMYTVYLSHLNTPMLNKKIISYCCKVK